MADLYDTQLALAINIERIGINLKKTRLQTRTFEYLKKCLSNLEECWKEYQFNHDRLSTEVSKTHVYFTKQEYEKTCRSYQAVKTLINQMHQQLLEAPSKSEGQGLSTQETSIDKEVETEHESTEEQLQGDGQSTELGRKAGLTCMVNQGTNSKLDVMFRKQAANFKAFRRTVSNINLELISDKWEFEDVLKSLQTRWSVIDTLHWEIDSELGEENGEYESTFLSHEQQYNSLKKAINTKMWSVAHREKSTPKLEIPIFSGNYNQWTSFKDLFQEAIHNNPSLSSAQKMQFLKGKVKGEAERLIQHLQISAGNYSICWEILQHRYNNKRAIFSSHMNILLGLPNMQHQSLPQIKKLHDTTLECLNAIRNLGIDITSWDPIMVHILSQKLDSESYADYIESLKNSRELPILQEFLDFLEIKFISLESARRKHDNPQQRGISNNQPHASGYKKHSFTQTYKNNNPNDRNDGSLKKELHVSKIKCPRCNGEHGLYNCKTFLELPAEQKLTAAHQLQVCINCLFSHNGNKCTSTKRCRKCTAYHNTILHDAFMKPANTSSSNFPLNKHNEHAVKVSNASQDDDAEILLATALVKVMAADGIYYNMRALIDQGSQISLITEKAAQLLKIKRQKCKGTILGVGEKESNCKGMINITCKSINEDYTFSTEVLIMNNLLKNLPNHTFTKPSWSFTENIKLADPEYNISKPVDLLLGAEVYAHIIMEGIIKGTNLSQPIAQQTHLGWILCGGSSKTFQCNVVLQNLEDIQKFWEVEEISEQSNLSLEDQECITFYLNTTTRKDNGRYEVRLPLKEDIGNKLGSSKKMALAQFRNLERKFQKHQTLAYHYKTFMDEYLELKHMKLALRSNIKPECYLPHHGVLREESITTKYRVVFNASSRTSSGYSLNDLMHKGPNLQQDLQSLLLKWRQYKYAYTADIEKMYRQILINELDQPLQKVFWRNDPKHPIQSYQLTTVTYGTKAAPFLALMTLKKLAADEQKNFADAAQVLEYSSYMDDVVHGCHSIEQGKKLISDLISLLKSGGFNLRKWASNEPKLIKHIVNHQNPDTNIIFNLKSESTPKTLGLCWNTNTDNFFFRCDFSKQYFKPTKRNLLSEISKLFDPLGWLTPLSTKLKLLFQKLWKNNLQWDDEVSNDILDEWSKIKADIHNIHCCEIPRWLNNNGDDTIEIHGFCDASMEAYACVVYARIKHQSKILLIAAKSKLVPHKKALTLPKLELSGAYLLSRLINKIQQCLTNNLEIYGWTDSMVALSWMKGEPNRWKTFVANRVNKITNVMPPECWRYVKSIDNPADCASRGMLASQLLKHALWWQGPHWLQTWTPADETEKQTFETNEEVRTINKHVNTVQNSPNIIDCLLEKYNNINKITRILAWIICRAFKPACYRKQLPNYLMLHELRNAKTIIIRHVQNKEFGKEIERLRKHGKVESKSQLLNLEPFIDQNGLLRVGGRLKNASMSGEMRHPKIIPHNCRLAELLIDEAHRLTFHGGPRVTLANLRQQYWITSGNNATKKQIRKCVICRKHETGKQYQLMGDLPEERCNPAPPFYHTGVDYTGFVEIKTNKGRGVKTTKGYVAVFICLVTKAVHLELVSDLTSFAFLAALKRMAARRGAPHHLYSDQGTNFVGANNILESKYQQLQQVFNDSFLTEVTDLKIEWHFNAPSWPSAGGLWERAVRSLKFHLKRVIGEQKLTFEEYSTLLAQLEACLNTRPLCPITENIEDLDFLTPAHFLTSRAGLTVIETEDDARTRWHLVRKLSEDIWRKWKSEYLSQLTARSKWLKPQQNLKIGDLVVIQENNIPTGKWAMGRVVNVHPGKDGLVRVVSLKTKNGIVKRPIIKLSLLPINMPDTKKEENITRRRRMPIRLGQVNFTSVALTLILFMSVLVNTTYGIYNITKLRNNQSLYFDSVAKLSLIRDKWTLVVYYDMAPFWEGTRALEKLLSHLNNTCTTADSGVCNMIVPQLQHEFTELRYYNTLLMTQQFIAHSRQRRGLINGIGYAANYLFGVLDEHFAEQYTKDIELLKQNQKYMAKLWKNQTSVVESEYNILKRTERIIHKQHKNINQHLQKLDKLTNGVQQVMTNMSVVQSQIETALTANTLLQTLRGNQDTLVDTLTDIHHGQFNIHLLTPKQLQQELNVIAGQLSDDITLPVDQTDVRKLYHILQIKARITEEYFIFQITFPLISRDQYRLYRVLPVPKQFGKNMTSIVPKSDYIGVNLRKDSYIPINFDELSKCLTKDETYMCLLRKPVYHLGSDDNSYCNLNHETNQCKIEQNLCSNKWIPLSNPSEYFFHCCNNYSIKIICGEQVTVRQLSQAGLIYLGQGCVIKGQDFTLHANTMFGNNITVTPGVYVPNIDQLNNIINVSIPVEMKNNNQTDERELGDDLLKIYKQIKQMRSNEIELEEALTPHDIHHYVVSYTLVLVAIVVAVVFLWRWRRRRMRGVHISSNLELRSINDASVSSCVRQQKADRQPSEESEVKACVVSKQNKACSPIVNRNRY